MVIFACRYHTECDAITETITLPAQGHESIYEDPAPIVVKTREFFGQTAEADLEFESS
jgi:hypothetical protein